MEAIGVLSVLSLILWYVVLSIGLVHYNAQLVRRDRFPHAMLLSTLQMATTCVLCNALYLLCPSLYPSMERTAGKRVQLLARFFLPVGALFAMGLFCSNQAYLFCSAAFLQYVKETSVAVAYIMSCCVGLQSCSRVRVLNIIWVMSGAAIAVTGEVHFMLNGLIFSLISTFGECSKNVLGDWLMNGKRYNLDALTYLLFMSPMCTLVLIFGTACTWNMRIVEDLSIWWPWLLPNLGLAFILNVTIATLIKQCSAIAFILAGLVKDVGIVVISTAVFHDAVSVQQSIGFAVCLTGALFWSYSRIAPKSRAVESFQTLAALVPLPVWGSPTHAQREKSSRAEGREAGTLPRSRPR